MPGGFLGVDVFFVISGYLITSLLLREFRRGGHVQLGRFWLRRARRLLPAVGVLIAVTMVVAAIVEPDRIDALRGDALASLAYVANWHFIFSHQSYFEQFQRPSLFTHLWSLSVEEQFYLFWPLVFAVGMKLFGRGRLLIGVLAGALGSVGARLDPLRPRLATPPASTTAPTPTPSACWRAWRWRWSGARSSCAGAAPARWSARSSTSSASSPSPTSCSASSTSTTTTWRSTTAATSGWRSSPRCCWPSSPTRPPGSAGCSGRPRSLWLGLRSYSFYLWHYPVLMLTRPGVDVSLPRGVLIPLQLIAVLALADLSYRFVELPFRGQAKLPGLPDGWLRVARPALLVAVLAIVVGVGWSGLFAEPATTPERRRGLDRHLRPGRRAAGLPQPQGPAADPRPRRLGDDRRQGQARRPPRAGLLDERPGRPPGRRIRRHRATAEAPRPQPRGDDHPDGQQRPALRRRHGSDQEGHLRGRRAVPDRRPRPGQLDRTSPTTPSPKPRRTGRTRP